MKSRRKFVALLGGSFNPPTMGHIQLARKVLEYCPDITDVWLVPCYHHNHGKVLTDAKHRIAMCELACSDEKSISVCSFEVDRKIIGGTINFVSRIKHRWGKRNFFYVVGLDVANQVQTWTRWEELKNLVPFIVHQREGVTKKKSVDWYNYPPHRIIEGGSGVDEISSTDVRSWFKDKDVNQNLIDIFVHPKVSEYITQNKLYAA